MSRRRRAKRAKRKTEWKVWSTKQKTDSMTSMDGSDECNVSLCGEERSWENSAHLCRTVVTESGERRDCEHEAMKRKQHRTVSVRTSDGIGIRTRRGNVVFKNTGDGYETVLQAGRTVVMEGTVKGMMDLRRI